MLMCLTFNKAELYDCFYCDSVYKYSVILCCNDLIFVLKFVNVVGKDLGSLGVQEWSELVQDREKWRDIVMAAITLREYYVPEEEED